ncbi:hypothetical protein AB0F72_08875 [Actinoplanes sp. NPDC023936]|uniref:hypothetical protein n=1 Tax=Actinoplanes sp. NPDC023936 TaxID=3154910 RepID=UPI0033F30B45
MTEAIVYGFRTLDPFTLSSIELGYVGQTRQGLRSREFTHRDEQPWADIIVGSAYIIAAGSWTDSELDQVEQWSIFAMKPRYNVSFNQGNEGRIPPEVAVAQRLARDRVRGVPLWRPEPAVPVFVPVAESATALSDWQQHRATKLSTLPLGAGHKRILEFIASGVNRPGELASASGYSERQVYNLLNELKDQFRLIRRESHGRYLLVEGKS